MGAVDVAVKRGGGESGAPGVELGALGGEGGAEGGVEVAQAGGELGGLLGGAGGPQGAGELELDFEVFGVIRIGDLGVSGDDTAEKCDRGRGLAPSDLVLEGNEVQLVELSAGTHFLRATANSRTSPHVTVSLLPK